MNQKEPLLTEDTSFPPSNRDDRVAQFLNFDWLYEQLVATGPDALFAQFATLPRADFSADVQHALMIMERLIGGDAHILSDATQLVSRIVGRLLDEPNPLLAFGGRIVVGLWRVYW